MKKFLESELKELKDIRANYLSIQDRLGAIEIQKQVLKESKDIILEEFKGIQKKEADLANELTKKYGEGTIDIDKGEFIPKS